MTRIKGTIGAFKMCRGFGVGVGHSAYRALRFLFTGSTGRYKIKPLF